MKEYVGIYIKTEKAQEQDGFGNKMKYHFHITTVHKYRFFVFCLYSSCVYLCRVVMNVIGMEAKTKQQQALDS